jgi:hypothetical protein
MVEDFGQKGMTFNNSKWKRGSVPVKTLESMYQAKQYTGLYIRQISVRTTKPQQQKNGTILKTGRCGNHYT